MSQYGQLFRTEYDSLIRPYTRRVALVMQLTDPTANGVCFICLPGSLSIVHQLSDMTLDFLLSGCVTCSPCTKEDLSYPHNIRSCWCPRPGMSLRIRTTILELLQVEQIRRGDRRRYLVDKDTDVLEERLKWLYYTLSAKNRDSIHSQI
jgi:hypothetical protein